MISLDFLILVYLKNILGLNFELILYLTLNVHIFLIIFLK